MKPLKLSIEGINSFLAERTIDFEQLSQDGIFCICGPTGSGKTTVLDCVILALYAPSKHNRGNLKDYINTKSDKGKITLDFTADGARYRVYRELRRNSSSAARLTNLDTGEVLADKADSVTERIKGMLKLDKDDFTKVVVLEQGKFAEFMQMQKAERVKTVAKLFNLERFEKLKKTVADACNNCDKELKALDSALMQYEGVTEAVFAEVKKEKNETEKLCAEKQAQTEKLEADVKQKEKLAEVAEKRAQAEKNLQDALDLLKFAEREKEFAANEREKCEKEKETLIELKKRSDAANVTLSQIKECERDGKEVEELESKRFALTEQYKDAVARCENFSARLSATASVKDESEKKIAELAAKLSGANYPLCGCSEADFAAVRIKAENDSDKSKDATAKKIEAEKASRAETVILETLFLERSALERERESIKARLAAAKEEYEAARVLNAAAAVRGALKSGERCPVCGGEYCGETAPQCESAELTALKESCDALERSAQDADKKFGSNEVEYARHTEALSAAKKSLSECEETLCKICGEPSAAFEWAKLGAETAKVLADVEKERSELAANLTAAEKERDSVTAEGKKIRADTDKLKTKIAERLGGKTIQVAENEARAAIEEYEKAQKAQAEKEEVLRKKESELAAREAGLLAKSDAEREIIKTLPKEPFNREEFTAAKFALEEIRKEFAQFAEKSGRLQNEIERLRESLNKYKELAQIKKGLALKQDELIKLNKCVSSENKLFSFVAEEYVQSFTYAASETLSSLSGGKYTLWYDEGDFWVEDFFADNARRKVKTLSGGETFLASLSIAMAISGEIASQNYEFFFIDEGFGTLHERAMETVTQALVKLSRDTTVGIVTHRAELADRIPARLNVIPATEDDGSDIAYSTGT